MKKRGLLGFLVVGLLVVFGAVRIVPPGKAAWSPRGRLVVAGTLEVLPRWVYSQQAAPVLEGAVPVSTQEGAQVMARVRVVFPSGRYVFPAGSSAAESFHALLRENTPVLDVACVTGGTADGCSQRWVQSWRGNLGHRLGVPEKCVEVSLEGGAPALAAARRAKLRASLSAPARRVLLVGWDGADWELLKVFARQGLMPVLRGLMDRGTWGKLSSFTPLLSPIIWTTVATGEPPERHGILDFLEVEPASGTKVPVTGRKRAVPALWNIASAMGLTVAVSGWWASWPAETVNGVMVSDRLFFLLADSGNEVPRGTVVFPPEREAFFRALVRQAEKETDQQAVLSLFPVSPERVAQAVTQGRGMADPVDGFRRILVGTRVYLAAAEEMLKLKPHLAMVYVMGTDEIGHVLAPLLPPPLPGADPTLTEAAKLAVERYFITVDRWLGRLLAGCPLEECAVVLVSDHGFKWGADRPREFSGVAAATAALWHRPEGIFLVAGNGVVSRGWVEEPASVYDVAPGVLALLGLPPGEGWQGKPLPGIKASHQQKIVWSQFVPPESYRPPIPSVAPSPEYVAQLKALGYLEGSEGRPSSGFATEGELNNLGLVQLEAKRYAQAEEAFKQAIAKNPDYASPYYNLRRLYFETARYDEADQALAAAIQRGLRDGVGAMSRAISDYRHRGLHERALRLALRSRELFPQEPRLAAQLLALHLELGRCQEGLEVAKEAVRSFPKDPGVLGFAGLAAACRGEALLARDWLTQSLALSPNQPELQRALQELEVK